MSVCSRVASPRVMPLIFTSAIGRKVPRARAAGIENLVPGQDRAAAVRTPAKSARQKSGCRQVSMFSPRLARREPPAGQHQQLHIGHGLHPPLELHLVLRAEQPLKKADEK